MSTSFHYKTTGQPKNTNASIKAYLRQVVAYSQNNWVDYLLLGKFAANNHILTTTGLTPFFVNKGYHPQSSIEPPEPIDKELPYRKRLKILLTDQHADRIKNLLDYYKGEMA